jgi:hypothetical protein
MDIVDYELLIGNTFWYVDAETFSIYKGVCKVVTIKIYEDEENITQTTILYLLDIGDSGTVYVDDALAFDTYTEAATYLGTLYNPDEVITP